MKHLIWANLCLLKSDRYFCNVTSSVFVTLLLQHLCYLYDRPWPAGNNIFVVFAQKKQGLFHYFFSFDNLL